MKEPEWANDALFRAAMGPVLRHEGGYANHRSDPGGPTNFGISLRYLRRLGPIKGDIDHDGDVDADDVRRMTADKAMTLYYAGWWKPYGYGRFNLQVGGKVMDMAVNMGAKPAHILLQRAVRAVRGTVLNEDGIIGSKTCEAVMACNPFILRVALRSESGGHYRLLAQSNPKLNSFLEGWLNRAAW